MNNRTMTRDGIFRKLRKQKGYLRKRFKVRSLELFGSFSRDTARKDSDVDILVEFNGPVDLLEFIELECYLGEVLGRKVDLVTKAALKPLIRDGILKEAVMI